MTFCGENASCAASRTSRARTDTISCGLPPRMSIHTEVEEYPLEEANEALVRLKSGGVRGAAVLVP